MLVEVHDSRSKLIFVYNNKQIQTVMSNSAPRVGQMVTLWLGKDLVECRFIVYQVEMNYQKRPEFTDKEDSTLAFVYLRPLTVQENITLENNRSVPTGYEYEEWDDRQKEAIGKV